MITCWVVKHLDPDWKVAHKLWSLRIAFFWMLMQGLYMWLPALQDYISLYHFLGVCILFTFLIGVGRLTKQPGLD